MADFGGKKLSELVSPGVITGEDVMTVFKYAKAHGFAIPAINCTSSSTVNAVLEAAKLVKSPVIIQLSQGGCAFFAGKGLDNKNEKASIAGAIAGAHHVRAMAKHYGVPVILHSDHCARKLLPWFDGMLQADADYKKEHGVPLFSSHMLDLSEDPLHENIATSVEYFKKCKELDVQLEIELGITGGEEDGVDNTGVDNDELYSKPEEVWEFYRSLSEVGPNFTIAAAFGNVHGVYQPGNVRLRPEKLRDHQIFIKEQLKSKDDKPVFFVFHGGSGSTLQEIRDAISYGVVKMNIDTDTQWAYWDGVRRFDIENHDYLQGQIGNPKGPNKPNKGYYDPRVWLRKGEQSMVERAKEAFEALKSTNSYA